MFHKQSALKKLVRRNDCIPAGPAKSAYLHIGESHRAYLGSGTIDFTSFFKALASINYQGPITFECFSSTVVAAGLSNQCDCMKAIVEQSTLHIVHEKHERHEKKQCLLLS